MPGCTSSGCGAQNNRRKPTKKGSKAPSKQNSCAARKCCVDTAKKAQSKKVTVIISKQVVSILVLLFVFRKPVDLQRKQVLNDPLNMMIILVVAAVLAMNVPVAVPALNTAHAARVTHILVTHLAKKTAAKIKNIANIINYYYYNFIL